jgi:hypothetical protein
MDGAKVAIARESELRLSEDERRRMVAEAAYYRAERRGFAAGGEVEDWLTAEREVNQRLAVHSATQRAPERLGATSQSAGMRSRPTH